MAQDTRVNTISYENSFKSTLRTYGESGCRKVDILRIPFPERIDLKKAQKNYSSVFNYSTEISETPDKEKLVKKYVNNYIKGSLGSSFKNNKLQPNGRCASLCCKKAKSLIESDIPELTVQKRPPACERFFDCRENGAYIRVNRLAKKSNYNPLRSASNDELSYDRRMEKLNNVERSCRIHRYMNSDQIKNEAFCNSNSIDLGRGDKITERSYFTAMNLTKSLMKEPKRYLSNKAHKFWNHGGFYP